MVYYPKKIYVEKRLRQNEHVRSIIKRSKTNSIEYIEKDHKKEGSSKDLYLITNPGSYYKECPGTPVYVCCKYKILNFSTGCPIQCTYCILNSYFQNSALTYFCDHENMFYQLDKKISGSNFLRIGSGEFTDSLVLDHITNFSDIIIPYFLKKKNVLFELKTKTVNIKNLLNYDPKKRIMVSWSINPLNINKTEEPGSASIDERIKAAKDCQNNNYLLGFHFDPIIKHENWHENYCRAIDKIYQNIDPNYIGWISLGCFRFMPCLKDYIKNNFKNTKIIYEEFVMGKDGKMRYIRPVRESIYSTIINRIKRYHKNAPIYFCMETPLIWQRMLGKNNFDSEMLKSLLDKTEHKLGKTI